MNMEQAGRLATAVRFGNRLAPLVGRHLTGQKGLGRPLRSGLRPADCGSRTGDSHKRLTTK